MGYIYKITNLVNNKLYIGQTTRNIDIRFKEHVRDARRSDRSTSPLHKAIIKYGEKNFSIQIIEQVDNSLLNDRQIYWISYYKATNGHIGYNAASGGNVNYAARDWVYQHPEEVKANLQRIRPLTIQSVKQMWADPQRRANLVQKRKEQAAARWQNDPQKEHNHMLQMNKKSVEKCSIPVLMCDPKTHEVIKEFPSVSQGARYVQTYSTNISAVCKGKAKTSKGYYWKYKDITS